MAPNAEGSANVQPAHIMDAMQPTVLLGLITAYKEVIKASMSELLFGTTICIPDEFIIVSDQPSDQ